MRRSLALSEIESCLLPYEVRVFAREYLSLLGDEPQALVRRFCLPYLATDSLQLDVGTGEDGIGDLAAGAIGKKQFARGEFWPVIHHHFV